jgi:hypothetical protein
MLPLGYSIPLILLSARDSIFKKEFSNAIVGSAKVPLNRLKSKYLAKPKKHEDLST